MTAPNCKNVVIYILKKKERRKLSSKEWEDSLHESCINGRDQKLAIDLVHLMKTQ